VFAGVREDPVEPREGVAAVMEFPEEPRVPDAHGSPRSRSEHETEVWLRRELAFLYGVERRIRRRTRLRREAWRGAAVALILAMFAACWYLAAISSDSIASNSGRACPAATATAVLGSAHHVKTSAPAESAATSSDCAS
jgi:hypothetical protein